MRQSITLDAQKTEQSSVRNERIINCMSALWCVVSIVFFVAQNGKFNQLNLPLNPALFLYFSLQNDFFGMSCIDCAVSCSLLSFVFSLNLN